MGALLAAHVALIAANWHVDGDTLTDMRQVASAGSLREALTHRGKFTLAYVAESPVTRLATAVVRTVLPRWHTLDTARMLSLAGAGAVGLLLLRAARAAGAGPAVMLLACILPFCWHGFSFLIAECDNNVPADALRVAVLLALARMVRRPAVGTLLPPGGTAAGLLLGAAIAWHLQCALLVPVAAWAAWTAGAGLRPVRRALGALAVPACALAVYAASVACAVDAGVLERTTPGEFLFGLFQHHAGNTGDFFFTSGRTLVQQAALLREGWGTMVLGWPWVRPEGAFAALA
ncbi:MAG: hypothetical protein AAB368_01015, partial [bacterium]